MRISEIVVRASQKESVVFNLGDERFIQDVHDSCVLWNSLELWGVPADLDEEGLEEAYEGETNHLSKIGTVSGYLILANEIIRQGEDPMLVCDDISGDLGDVFLGLSETLHDSCWEEDFGPSVFYIEELSFEEHYRNDGHTKARILNGLPEISFCLLHHKPDLLAFIPNFLGQPGVETEDDRSPGKHAVAETGFGGALVEDDPMELPFGKAYFRAEDLEFIQPLDNRPIISRADWKDHPELELFLHCGFKPTLSGDVLYKEILQ